MENNKLYDKVITKLQDKDTPKIELKWIFIIYLK